LDDIIDTFDRPLTLISIFNIVYFSFNIFRFVLLLEIVELIGQAVQLGTFSSQRDYSWIIGVSVVMILGGLSIPIPGLIASWGDEYAFTSKVEILAYYTRYY
jgi:hypothetical protein